MKWPWTRNEVAPADSDPSDRLLKRYDIAGLKTTVKKSRLDNGQYYYDLMLSPVPNMDVFWSLYGLLGMRGYGGGGMTHQNIGQIGIGTVKSESDLARVLAEFARKIPDVATLNEFYTAAKRQEGEVAAQREEKMAQEATGPGAAAVVAYLRQQGIQLTEAHSIGVQSVLVNDWKSRQRSGGATKTK